VPSDAGPITKGFQGIKGSKAMASSILSRRTLLKLAGAAVPLSSGLVPRMARAAADTLTIAYNVNLPAFDPTVGASAVNPTIQSIYQAIFDPYIGQAPDLSFKPGLLTKWGWNADRTKVTLELRKGATWHDGSPVTPEDVVWSLQRAADPKSGNPIQFVWSKVNNYKIDGNTITGDVVEFEPTLFKWMAFLTGYVLPKSYYEKVGAEGFEKAPIGSGPYKVDAFERNAFLRLKANPNYFGGKPAFETVIFKFVPDTTSRVAEIESGSSDVTLEIPYEDFDRLKKKKGYDGVATPVSDIGMIFISNVDPMLDKNVRLAANMAIDKEAISKAFFNGAAKPISVLAVPGSPGYVDGFTFPYSLDKAKENLAKSGFGPDKPAKIHFFTTNGAFPNDFEMARAIAQMWKKIGIDAEIEVIELAKYYELNHAGKMPEATLYRWGNDTGDPEIYTGYILNPKLRFSAWKSDDIAEPIARLFGETNYEKRIKGYRDLNVMVVEKGYAMPLLQGVSTVAYRDNVGFTAYGNGWILPATMTKK